ncbi:MAG: AMP-binding protein [Candidatus Marinimicrobia bacterium]|nr:AMP-binding protein [Candidatus Neomarinimicrobiota bacterium]
MELIPQLIFKNMRNLADKPAISTRNDSGVWESTTWSEFGNEVNAVSKSLIAMGMNPDDKISIYGFNAKSWYSTYFGMQVIGGVSVGVYHTCSSSEVNWIVGNSDSKVVFVGQNPMDNGEASKMPNQRLLASLDELPNVEAVVMFPGVEVLNHPKMMTWDDFILKGSNIEDEAVQSRLNSLSSDSVACLIYTSGTTGNPKGVMLTHGNWSFELKSGQKIFGIENGERYISWLPLAHVFGQLIDLNYWAYKGMHLHVCNNPLMVVDYAKEVKPHFFIGVPRIYEKIFSNLNAAISEKAILKKGLKLPLLGGLLRKKLKEAVGFSDTRIMISGAAPINTDILELFHNLGIPLYEGYGMTENTGGASSNYPGHNKIGAVGKPVPDTEIKIANDGEVLIKGSHVMKGYYKNPDATKETIVDGWLHTGDVGEMDSDGYLKITGRKKEIYVSSGGKNIAPLIIEETMKSIPIVSQCFLVGDGRKYCSALFTLDVGAILRDKLNVDAQKIPKDPVEQLAMLSSKGHDLSDFTESEDIKAEIQTQVDNLNGQFSNPEQVKKFSILPRDFTIDDGELTPTLKIRRIQIRENWAHIINAMYTD